MAKGGVRPGAGRPKGSTTKPQLASYFTEEERLELIATVKERLKTNDRVLIHVLEQIFGRPVQALSDPDGSPLFSSLKELSDGELESLAATGEGGTREEGTSTA